MQIIRSRADAAYKAPFTTMPDCVRQTFQHNGLRAPFQGLGATLVRNIPANAVYLGSFEVLKQQAAQARGIETRDLPPHIVMAAASTGGIAYWLCIYPVDMIKSAIMTDAIKREDRKYPNMRVAAQKLWAEGGVARFYKGFAPCLIRAAPANAAMLYTVDAVNNYTSQL